MRQGIAAAASLPHFLRVREERHAQLGKGSCWHSPLHPREMWKSFVAQENHRAWQHQELLEVNNSQQKGSVVRKKLKEEEPIGGSWVWLTAPNGNSILRHSCLRCGHSTLVPKNVPQNEKRAWCCGKFVTPPEETWLSKIEREKTPTYSMPILPIPHFDRAATE